MTVTSARHWLTPDAHARLVSELAELVRGQDRAGTTDPDDPAADHDEHDEFVQNSHRLARIRRIRELLRQAVVGEDPPDDGIAEPGMVLTVRYDDADTAETFLLGTRDEVEHSDLEVFSPDSPIGRALSGARPGEQRTYRVPNGAAVRVTLVNAEPYGHFRRTTGQ
ncbi:GreA/GreB family elongation factor [Amycolatopsis ultiminotia]|uniref:GreA/GreB family elongation factor n=1 Tax=Amycolatopsis ultiminotia TaxID=543629 RepID=A0ABP6XVW0_9PSEU